jgi:hypothetical protein
MTAQWLTIKFAITAKEAKVNGCTILQGVCHEKHMDVAKWFVREFCVVAEEIGADSSFAGRDMFLSGALR